MTTCFDGFVMSILDFSVMEHDQFAQKNSDLTGWSCYYGKMAAIATGLYTTFYRVFILFLL